MNLRDSAHKYLDRGFSIIPVSGKVPALKSWKKYQIQPPTSSAVDHWLRTSSTTGIAIVCGSVSGNLVCRDFGDAGVYKIWAEDHHRLAHELPTVKTVRGFHVYFRSDLNMIRAQTRAKCEIRLADGELRFDSVYCVAPPSIHPTRVVYKWIIELPESDILMIDPFKEDLVLLNCREGLTEQTQHTEHSEQTKAIRRMLTQNKICAVLVEKAIIKTQPTEFSTRNRRIFDFARELRAIAGCVDADTKTLRSIVREWHRRALPNIRTMEFEETWYDFMISWSRIKLPAGEGPLELALKRLDASKLPKVAQEYGRYELRLLVALCRELQLTVEDQPFFLACRTAGKQVGVSHELAAQWLRTLVFDEILELVKKGKSPNASRYRYISLS